MNIVRALASRVLITRIVSEAMRGKWHSNTIAQPTSARHCNLFPHPLQRHLRNTRRRRQKEPSGTLIAAPVTWGDPEARSQREGRLDSWRLAYAGFFFFVGWISLTKLSGLCGS